ncbi:conserved hypothetical protein [Candidatus Propionivibrio aalborgensis]|uniref:HNH endonuclease n=1 Tax=Candidatus Propionivibrio aalborgensis TaxID=1860101 RepID=A0A1A8Y1D0_9RHOO|nr:conserved hypothetical protein [Candidatus Propionivibrio aalborgensis]
MQPYRSKEWAKFRSEVIRLDGNECTVCGRATSDGVVLQVHHKQYFPGRPPWDYPYDACETICRGCHAAAHGLIPPKFGWEHAGWDDLGDLTGTCECCGTSIRYTFLVQHPDWRPMEVGEICCDHLTSSQLASNLMESKRRYAGRLKRFVSSSRWCVLPGDIHRITQKRLTVEIVPVGTAFKLRVNTRMGKKVFPSALDAKANVFELIEQGTLHAYISKQVSHRP